MRHRNWFWGIFFVAAGFFVIACQVGGFVQLDFWSIVATVLLAAVFVSSLVEFNFFGLFVPLALLYAIYQQPLHLKVINVWLLLLTAVLASTGFSIIFHGPHHHWHKKIHAEWEGISKTEERVDGNDVRVSASFSESCKYLHSESLEKAYLSSSFGKLSVYFDQVTPGPNGVQVYADVSFGNMTLYIPSGWRVEERIHTSAGAVNIDPRGTKPADDAPLLILEGKVSFGNLEIHYVS